MKRLLPLICLLLFTLPLWGRAIGLDEARAMALAADQSLQATQQQTAAARQEQLAAYTNYLPTVTFEGGFRWDDDLIHYDTGVLQLPIYDVSSGHPQQVQTQFAALQVDEDFGQHTNASFSMAATQPLFTGGKIWRNTRIRTGLHEVAQQQQELHRQETLLGVDEAYWRVAELTAKVRLAEQYREAVQQHVNELNDYLAAGLVTNNDVLKARVKLSEADLLLLQARDGLALAKMDLARRLGADDDLTPADSIDTAPPTDVLSGTPSVDNRPELKALEQSVRIHRDLAGVQLAGLFPQFALKAAYTLTRPNPYNSFENEYGDNWQGWLLCQWQVFDFNRTGFSYSAARHQARAAQMTCDDTRDQIDLQIRQERFRLDESEQRVTLARTNAQQAAENLRDCANLFHEGVLKSSDLLDAQTLWQQARSTLIESLAARNVQITRYRKACGQL